MAQNQARNDASNRAEFLSSLAERRKRQRVGEAEGDDRSTDQSNATSLEIDAHKTGSCARADAKPIDRDAQMKYDIAKDDSGPLSRSAKAGLLSENGKINTSEATEITPKTSMGATTTVVNDEEVTSARHPGLDERLKNIEDHIAVRFGIYNFSVLRVCTS